MRHQRKASARARRQVLRTELLEARFLLASDFAFQNQYQRLDVNLDLRVSPVDALNVINQIAKTSPDRVLPDVNTEGRFYDVNGSNTASPLDALLVINALARQDSLVSAKLVEDSAPSDQQNFDRVTSRYALEFGLTFGFSSDNLEIRIDGSPSDPFVRISESLVDEKLLLSESRIAELAGQPLSDGVHQIEIRVEGSDIIETFEIELDTQAPTGQVLVSQTINQAPDFIDLEFDESVSIDFDFENDFLLQRTNGNGAGTNVGIVSANEFLSRFVRLGLEEQLGDQSFSFEVLTSIFDAAGNSTTIDPVSFSVSDPTGIAELSPSPGESLVTVLRDVVVRFDEPVDATSVTGGGQSTIVESTSAANAGDGPAVYVIAGGERLAGRLVVSSTNEFATYYFDDPLPASTEVRIVVDGDRIVGQDGLALDADGDNQPGGTRTGDFRTLSLTPIPGTDVFGFVKDSSTGEPIVGATIRVDSLPDKSATTDINGRFELQDMPAPDFFVHVDGTTATNLPDGFVYPNVGKPFHSVPGQSVQLNHHGEIFDVFLPRMKESDVVSLSTTEMTEVGFGDDGKTRLTQMFPNIDPAMFDLLSVEFEPGSAIDDFGNPVTQAAIIPVEPDRIPAPLPSFLDPMLVVSIQAPGATSFDVPARVTFPNLEGLPPGESANIYSFDHDRGAWKYVGSGTVTPDGSAIVSDGGVIQAPGWHEVESGSVTRNGPGNEDEDTTAVSITGGSGFFSADDATKTIRISNTGSKDATVKLTFDAVDEFTSTGIAQSVIPLPSRSSELIELVWKSVTEEQIESLQDDDPDTNHAKVNTGSVKVVATVDGETVAEETFLYGSIIAPDGQLSFPAALEEESESEADPAANEVKTLVLEVTGPVDQLSFTGNDPELLFSETSDGAQFTVPTLKLADPALSPSGDLVLSNDDGMLPTVKVNEAATIDLDPFAIRRVSGEITGSIADLAFSINGEVEVGLAGDPFVPLFTISGSMEVNRDQLILQGAITTDLLKDIPGYSEDVELISGTVLKITRSSRKFELFPRGGGEAAPDGLQFKIAGMEVKITDLFLPDQVTGLGVRGSITLPKEIGDGKVKISIGDGENPDNAILITPDGVDVTGGLISFPDVSFTLFGVSAEATDLSLEYRKHGLEDGVERGNRLLLRGELDLKFPNFDPNLRISASFASPENEEDQLIDLSGTLGPAWTFALAEQPALAGIDSQADQAPAVQESPEDSFIRLELTPDGGLDLDAVGRIAISNAPLGKYVTISDAFLSIDTDNNNYLGFARVETPIKKAGEISALIGFEGGEFDIVALGVGQLNSGVGFQIGTTPLFLQSIGGGLKDLSQGLKGIDLIAAMTATLGPGTPQLFPAFSLPSWLGGLSFPGADLLRIDVGGNIGLDELNLGGQVVVGGDASGGVIEGVGKIEANFNQPSLKVSAKLDALDGLVTVSGMGGGEFATLTANSNFDVAFQGQATAKLPDDLPFGLGWAEGKTLSQANAKFEFSNDGVSSNNYLAFWGTVELFTLPLSSEPVTATAGLQVFLDLKLPNLITSLDEANSIASGAGEGEFTGQANFEIPSGESFVIFTTEWEVAAPDAEFQLTDPSGNTLDLDDIGSNPNAFLLSQSDTEVTVAIANPEPGTWSGTIFDPVLNDLGAIQTAALLDTDAPTISVNGLSFNGSQQLGVMFDTANATNDATVSIYLDDDRNDYDGVLLASNVPVDQNGQGNPTIDLSGIEFPAGEYFVYATLDDPGRPPALSEYIESGFSIEDSEALADVSNVKARWVGGRQLQVEWDPLAGAESYVVRLTSDAAGIDFAQTVNVADGSSMSVLLSDENVVTPLVFGETYRLAVIGIDSDGGVGSDGGQTVAIVGPFESVGLVAGEFDVFADPGMTYTGQLDLDPADDPVLVEAPIGASLSALGTFSWDVPNDATGFFDVVIKVTPEFGITRYESFRLLAEAAPDRSISGQVINDVNRNGVFDFGDTEADGIDVELVDVVTGVVLATATSGGGGAYAFDGLNVGDYRVRRSDVPDQPMTVSTQSGDLVNVILGNRANGSISGSVFVDLDFDGVADGTLSGIPVSIDLDNDGQFDASTTTMEDDPETDGIDETGFYQFSGLLAGTHRVVVGFAGELVAVDEDESVVSLGVDEDAENEDFIGQYQPIGDGAQAKLLNVTADSLVFQSIDFGQAVADAVGGDVVNIDLELLNLGGSNLSIESVSLSDPDVGFSVDGLSAGTTVLPESYLETSSAIPFSVSFDPSAPGFSSTLLRVETNADDSPLMIELVGNALADGPELVFDVVNNNLGGATVGDSVVSAELISIQNTGSQPLVITEILGGDEFQTVSLPGNFPGTPIELAPTESLEIGVEFSPSQAGLRGGEISVASNALSGSVLSHTVVGTGLASMGATTSSAAIGFDYVAIHTPAIPSAPVLRDISGPDGEFEFILTASSGYEAVLFDPVTGLVGAAIGVTSSSGQVTTIHQPSFFASVLPDSDGDLLPDDAEFAIGTAPDKVDTDGDGVSDFAELEQGLDPLSGLLTQTGILAGISLPGDVTAVDVVDQIGQQTRRLAYVAAGDAGLAAVDVSDVFSPIVLGMLGLSGTAVDVAVDPINEIAAVAAGDGGLHLVDVSDPMLPTLLSTVNVLAEHVEILSGIAYSVGSNGLAVVDSSTGQILQSVSSGAFTDVAREGRYLYTTEASDTIRVFEIGGLALEPKGTLNVDQGSGSLFVGNSIAYVMADEAFRGGFATVDVADPDAPALISNSDVVAPNIAPRDGLAANGSGLGLLFGQPGDDPVLDLVSIADPNDTNVAGDQFVSRITLPARALDVAIAGGVAYVAGGSSGLQIVSFLPFDSGDQPPAITLTTDVDDIDPITGGIQVLEGTTFSATVEATDDVQIRQVELLVDGQTRLTDLSFPFDLTGFLPTLEQGESSKTVQFQARATDTGGNQSLSAAVEIEIVTDDVPPSVVLISPPDQAELAAGFTQVRIQFSEAVTDDSLQTAVYELRDSVGNLIVPAGAISSGDQTEIALTYALVQSGEYTISFSESQVMDLAGNPLGSGIQTSSFSIAGSQFSASPIFPEMVVAGMEAPGDTQVADVNGDGFPDIVSVSQGPEIVNVALGNSEGTFEIPGVFPVDGSLRSVRVGDLNGDDRPDLVVAGLSTDASVLLGVGDGTFGPASSAPLGARPNALALADVDSADGPDILALNDSFGVTNLIVAKGDGNGGFLAATTVSLGVIGFARSLIAVDLNGDTILDVVASGTSVAVAIGNGDGTFQAPTRIVGVGGTVRAGFVDGDNHIDLLTDNFGTRIDVLPGDGSGTFGAAISTPTVGGQGFVTGDFDGDGSFDVATLFEEGPASGAFTSAVVLLSQGDGTFDDATRIPVGGAPDRFLAADANGDGQVDLVLSGDSLDGDGSVSILFGKGDGSFRGQQRKNAGADPGQPGVPVPGPVSVDTGDVNGDGIADVVTANLVAGDVSVLFGNADGSLSDEIRFPVNGNPRVVKVVNVDSDGDLDIVTVNDTTGSVSVLIGDGLGGFESEVSYDAGPNANSMVARDVSGDGHVDLIVGNQDQDSVSVLLGIGDGSFADRSVIDVDSGGSFGPISVAVGDVTGDGLDDIVTVDRGFGTSSVSVLAGTGGGSFSSGVKLFDLTGGTSVQVGDFNGDRADDIAVTISEATFSPGFVNVFFALPGLGFSAPLILDVGRDPTSLLLADVDRDFLNDLVVVNARSGDVSVLLADGQGGFGRETRFRVGADPSSVAAADLNGDMAADLVIGNLSERDVSVLINQLPPAEGGGEGERVDSWLDETLLSDQPLSGPSVDEVLSGYRA